MFLPVVLMLTYFAYGDATFKIRKCCPSHQQTTFVNECEDFKQEKYGYSNLESDEEDSIKARPWWFPVGKDIKSRETNESIEVFPDDAIIDYCHQPCDSGQTSFILWDFNYTFFDDGSLLVYSNNDHPEDILFPPSSFCVDRFASYVERTYTNHSVKTDNRLGEESEFSLEQESVIKLCPCATATCVQKCCFPGLLYEIDASGLVDCVVDDKSSHENIWYPEITSEDNNTKDLYFLYHRPACDALNEALVLPNVHSSAEETFIIRPDGTAQIIGEEHIIPRYSYCVENLHFTDNGRKSQFLLRCSPLVGIKEQARGSIRLLYGTLFIIGAIFLFITLVIYLILPHRKTTNEKNLISQTLCLFVGYIGLAVGQLAISQLPPSLCTLLGFVVQYSFLSAFFWLNVLCFDIFSTFSDLRPLNGNIRHRRKFLFYSMYGWLCPAAISVVTAIIEFLPESSHVLRPEFRTSCWFKNESYAKLAYFYGPIAALLLVNIILFILTSYKITRAQQETAMVNKNNSDSKRLVLYFKLFLLMGVTWITELISWAVGGPQYYWYATDLVNLLRAVFMFVFLCCKRQVYTDLKLLLKNFPRQRQGRNRTSTITLATGTTNGNNGCTRSQVAVSQL